MTLDQVIALIGVIVAVIFGIIGVAVAKNVRQKRVSMRQSARDGSTAIMAGQDVNQGTPGRR